MGTSLALVGAYVLAGELTTRDDHREAFARFEATMRPYVDRAQKLPPGTPRLAFPRTRTGVTVLRSALRVGGAARSAGGSRGCRACSPRRPTRSTCCTTRPGTSAHIAVTRTGNRATAAMVNGLRYSTSSAISMSR